jgi:multidrug efflux pump subunit AcrA (membrane-fusion protein)
MIWIRSHLNPQRILLIVGLYLLLLTACSGKSLKAEQATPTPIPTPVIPTRPTFQVQRGEIISELRFTGRIAPLTKQELSFNKNGRIAKIYVNRGDEVSEGQLLAELETSQNEFDLRRAQTHLKIAQLQLDLALLQIPQTSELYTVTVAIQEQEVNLAQIALDELTAAYTSVQIISPINGSVFSLAIVEGDIAEADKPAIVVTRINHGRVRYANRGDENIGKSDRQEHCGS